jgi:hypothetical protein
MDRWVRRLAVWDLVALLVAGRLAAERLSWGLPRCAMEYPPPPCTRDNALCGQPWPLAREPFYRKPGRRRKSFPRSTPLSPGRAPELAPARWQCS